jgi:hypothetical protein
MAPEELVWLREVSEEAALAPFVLTEMRPAF